MQLSEGKMFKFLGIVLFCGLLIPSQGMDAGAFSAVSPGAFQNDVFTLAPWNDPIPAGKPSRHFSLVHWAEFKSCGPEEQYFPPGAEPGFPEGRAVCLSPEPTTDTYLHTCAGLPVTTVKRPTVTLMLLRGIWTRPAMNTSPDTDGKWLRNAKYVSGSFSALAALRNSDLK
ncbi:unnamed protein product [Natator depressus]